MDTCETREARSISTLRPFAKLLWKARVIRCYCDGDGAGFVWRWWHPVTWILAPATFILGILLVGIPETWRDKHDIGFGMKPWFVANPDRLIWIRHTPKAPS